ncbi:MAG TPA: alpha/beta fold hydrolase [Ilumatobacteraceae bacterium]|nr:alpha/beta fold hydrolase [Ilumatobacteraceae bacterium]HRB04549.1 alpha/beta fold hydrolase [Ilumatobacteraceae bacterium]
MPSATLADIDVYYEMHGSGPRLLLLNGSGGTVAAAAPMIQKLAEHFEVLIHDQRGLGRTTVPRDTPSMADYAADAAALLDHVGWASTLVFGISFGGMVAQECAVTWPQRVERMSLLCTSPGGAGGSSYPLHTLAEMTADEQNRVRLRLADSRYTPGYLAAHPFDQRLVELAVAGRCAPRTDEQLRGEAMQLAARSGHDVWDRLGSIACPTLVAYGEFDALAPPENSRAIASRITGNELRGYQGGHGFVWQDRQAWPDIIEYLS